MRTLIKSLIAFWFIVFAGLTSLKAQEDEIISNWIPGDFAYVNHVCQNATILDQTAILYQESDEESIREADAMWRNAVATGLCIINSSNEFLVRLVEKYKEFPNMFGIEGYHGELWLVETTDPKGIVHRVFTGILSKKFSGRKPSLGSSASNYNI